MSPDEFVANVYEDVVERGAAEYEHMLNTYELSTTKYPVWRKALQMHAVLDNDERGMLYDFIRQIVVDTVSRVFGIIDGQTYFGDGTEEFRLSTVSQNQELSGELQNSLLAMYEERHL